MKKILLVMAIVFSLSQCLKDKTDFTNTDFLTADGCRILESPKKYANKKIKIQGILIVCGSQITMHFPECPIGEQLWIEFHQDYRNNSKPELTKLIDQMINETQPRIKEKRPSIVKLPSKELNVVAFGVFKTTVKEYPPLMKGEGKEGSPFRDEIEHPSKNYKYQFSIIKLDSVKLVEEN